MDGFFYVEQACVRENAQVYRAKGYGRRIVDLGGAYVERLASFGKVDGADQLNEGLYAVQQ